MGTQCKLYQLSWVMMLLVAGMTGCGSKEATIGKGTQGTVPREFKEIQQDLPKVPLPGLRSQGEQEALIETSRIVREAVRKREFPSPDQMEKLSAEQQETIRRALKVPTPE
jgi:hypothetical protein